MKIGVIAVSFFVLVSSCANSTDTVEIVVGGHQFNVEIAATPEEREQGLMFREDLPDDGGMLFVFPQAEMRSFWMKNTSIPLTIAYIGSDRRILETHDMVPYSLQPVRSRFPAKYALEVRQGRLLELGIGPGDVVSLPESVD